MVLTEADIDYFRKGGIENIEFWSHLGGKPSVRGASVLDIGCGHGRLCVDLALSGAAKVVGIDLNPLLIKFAEENLRKNFPNLTSKIEFVNVNLRDYPEFKFDYVFSKDAFEHILNLKSMINEMSKRLKVGGKIYTGFGPLYRTPYGDHKRTRTLIPYGHLLIPESIIISRLNRRRENKITCIQELGLNKMSLSDYLKVFSQSGLRIVYLRVNQGPILTRLSSLIALISRIRFLEEYISFNIFCILEKS